MSYFQSNQNCVQISQHLSRHPPFHLSDMMMLYLNYDE